MTRLQRYWTILALFTVKLGEAMAMVASTYEDERLPEKMVAELDEILDSGGEPEILLTLEDESDSDEWEYDEDEEEDDS